MKATTKPQSEATPRQAAPKPATPRQAASAEQSCSIQRTLDVVGDRWTLLILRDLFRGVRRFSQLQTDLDIARNLLSDRLARLTQADIVERIPYQDRPMRYEYVLTDKGRDLSPSLLALMRWGDQWCNQGEPEPPTVLVHSACGTPLEQQTRCPACEDLVAPTQIRSRNA